MKENHPIVNPPKTPPASFADSIPLPLVMMLAAPYIAGKTDKDALSKAHQLWNNEHFCSTIDILGEGAHTDEDCDLSVQSYISLINIITANLLPCKHWEEQITVSFKPSMFSSIVPREANSPKDMDRAYHRIETIVEYARKKNLRVTLEAEDHRWTDFHLDTYFSLINAGYSNLGTVVQSRLFRTKADLQRFDERMRVRIVLGIYNEPAEIAYTQKPVMKERAVEYAAELLSRGVYVELASHDTSCVHNFITKAVLPLKAHSLQFETQYLLGVPRKHMQRALVSGQYFQDLAKNEANVSNKAHLEELASRGSTVRMYLPYGTDAVAGPYCRRRLKANPNLMSYGIKNFFGLQ